MRAVVGLLTLALRARAITYEEDKFNRTCSSRPQGVFILIYIRAYVTRAYY